MGSPSPANQLLSGSDGSSFVYDEAGRLVEETRADGTRRGLSYDARGLLVQEVITEGGTGTVVDPCDTATPTTTGTEGDDVIVGTNGDDVIFGLGGNDEIDGGNGRDLICGGDGDDVLVDGSNSEDVLSGGPGNDRLDGGRGVDVLLGGDGDDVLSGGNGNDSLFGGAGADTLDGGQGDDTVDGGAGTDTLRGDRGNDTLQGGAGTDVIDGGQGEDQCEPEPGRVACELDLEPGEPARTVFTRSYDGDGLLVQVAVTHPDATVDVFGFTWDKTLPIPQVVSYTVNGASTGVVYGANRALAVDSNGTASGFEYSVLGDTIGGFASVASGFDPYGQPDTAATTVGFGYRGELHVGGMVYLRFRDLDPGLGRFTTVDPLDGVPGTTTVANQYAYAGNDPVQQTDPLGLRPNDRGVRPDEDLPGDPFEGVTRPRDKYDDFLDIALAQGFAAGTEAISRSIDSDVRGRVRISLFIESSRVFIFGRGDDRGFNQQFDPYETRATIIVDFDRGVAAAVALPSCNVFGGCSDAQPCGDGWGDNQVWIDESGMTIVGRFKNGFVPAPAIDFKIDLIATGWLVSSGSIVSNDFPSYEVYYDTPDGNTQTLYQFAERGFAVSNLDGDPVRWGGPWLG